MGAYVNPGNESKESWAERNAVSVTLDDLKKFDFTENSGLLPVVWVNNGPFTALAIAYCKKELDVFLDPNERRPQKYFLAEISDLLKVSNLESYL